MNNPPMAAPITADVGRDDEDPDVDICPCPPGMFGLGEIVAGPPKTTNELLRKEFKKGVHRQYTCIIYLAWEEGTCR